MWRFVLVLMLVVWLPGCGDVHRSLSNKHDERVKRFVQPEVIDVTPDSVVVKMQEDRPGAFINTAQYQDVEIMAAFACQAYTMKEPKFVSKYCGQHKMIRGTLVTDKCSFKHYLFACVEKPNPATGSEGEL